MTQGQLGIRARIPAKTLQNWEAKEQDIPEWAIERISDILEWPTAAEKWDETDHVYIVTLAGLTPFQFDQKLRYLGKYVESSFEVKRT